MLRYKITKQFAHSKEILIAIANDLHDCETFIKAIIKNSQPAIYRIYDQNTIAMAFNADSIKTTLPPQYETKKSSLPACIQHCFKLTCILINEEEENEIANFTYINDAKIFARTKLAQDIENKINKTYHIYDGDKIVETMNWLTDQIESEKQQPKKKSRFRLTPFSMKPHLGPGKFWQEIEDDDDKKD